MQRVAWLEHHSYDYKILQFAAIHCPQIVRQITKSGLPGAFTKPLLHLYVTVLCSGKLVWPSKAGWALGTSGGRLQSLCTASRHSSSSSSNMVSLPRRCNTAQAPRHAGLIPRGTGTHGDSATSAARPSGLQQGAVSCSTLSTHFIILQNPLRNIVKLYLTNAFLIIILPGKKSLPKK